MILWQPDNFSKLAIVYKSIKKEEQESLTSILGNYYENYVVKSIEQLVGTEINSNNYRVVLNLATSETVVLLRRCKFLQDSAQIQCYLQVMEILENDGVPVSHVLPTLKGELLVEDQGEYYILFDFIDGHHFAPNEVALASVAKSVALMHHSLDTLPNTYQEKIRFFSARNNQAYFNKIKQYNISDFTVLAQTIGKTNEDEVTQMVLKEVPFFCKIVEEIKFAEFRIAQLPEQIIHSDLHPHNALFVDNQMVAWLDFDSMRLSQRVRDIASALYRFGRQFFVAGDLSDQTIRGKAHHLGHLFQEHYTKICSLTAEEEVLMSLVIKDEFVRKLLFVLKSVYFEKNYTWAKDVPKFITALKEIDYFW